MTLPTVFVFSVLDIMQYRGFERTTTEKQPIFYLVVSLEHAESSPRSKSPLITKVVSARPRAQFVFPAGPK